MITHVTSKKKTESPLFRAILLLFVLLFLGGGSLLFLLFHPSRQTTSLTACIYQEGRLIETIDLSAVTEEYSFTVTASNGGSNTIHVRPGAIGITDADCPDGLCVSMGFANSSLLPIVCLPHELVIEVRPTTDTAPDMISY